MADQEKYPWAREIILEERRKSAIDMRERAAKLVEHMQVTILNSAGDYGPQDRGQFAAAIRALPLTTEQTSKPLPTDFPPPSDALKPGRRP